MLIGKLISFDELDSTNNYIKQHLDVLDSGTIVIAKNQTNGYGRKGRVWFNDKENSLTLSMLVKQNLRENLGLITQLTAVSVLKTLEQYNIKASIKWPNDILINNKKVCGILVENIISKNSVSVIIGIGININNKKFDKSIIDKATSLYLETNQRFDVLNIQNILLEKLENYYYQYLNNNTEFLDISRSNSCLIGKEIYLENQDETALVKGIDNLGRLIVEINGLEKVYSGSEVSLSNTYRSI
jgi:BirA family biotin operon repressor/biotin-[acetyl-CoA-carboxylase] ligase